MDAPQNPRGLPLSVALAQLLPERLSCSCSVGTSSVTLPPDSSPAKDTLCLWARLAD